MPHGDPKHRAKRWNERVKLVATLFNTVATLTLAAFFINPIAVDRVTTTQHVEGAIRHYDVFSNGGGWFLAGAALAHGIGQIALTFFSAEE